MPTLGESVTEATIGQWFKKVGDAVAADEPVVELETDKVTIEVPAPSAGVLESIAANPGDTVNVGALIGAIGNGAGVTVTAKPVEAARPRQLLHLPPLRLRLRPKAAAPAPAAAQSNGSASPSAAKLMTDERHCRVRRRWLGQARPDSQGRRADDDVQAVHRGSGCCRGDSARPSCRLRAKPAPAPAAAPARELRPRCRRLPPLRHRPLPAPRAPVAAQDDAREERVKMTRLRQTIARRLKEAQNTAAMLTTFNEVDMKPVMDLRNQYKDLFEKKHGVKLGFMGFFTKAVHPRAQGNPGSVNAEIEGDDLIYKNYAHIGVAVGTDKGLVVPVSARCRPAVDRRHRKGHQRAWASLRARRRADHGEDMQGGTFTISNGGVYGSLMSTPILNAPQSGILGMHKIQERPVLINGEVVIRPMMYLALSYDHRIVDGKEAVTFLVRVKESLEAPERLVLDL